MNRYTKAMFEVPRPQIIQSNSPTSEMLRRALTAINPDFELHTMAVAPLPALNRRPGKAVGFFEQGLLTGMTVLMVLVVSSALVLGYYGISMAQRRMRG